MLFQLLSVLGLPVLLFGHNPTLQIHIKGENAEIADIVLPLLSTSIRNGSLKASIEQVRCEECYAEIVISGNDLPGVEAQNTLGRNKSELVEILLRTIQEWSRQYFAQYEHFENTVSGWMRLASQVHSPLLNGEELTRFFEENSENTVFVLYYKPSGKLTNLISFLSFDLASHDLEDVKLAVVNCEKHSLLCEESKVHEYPSVWCYKAGQLYAEVDDDELLKIDVKFVRDWTRNLLQPVLRNIHEDEVPYFRSGIVPGFGEQKSSVHMLFIDSKKSTVYREFRKIAEQLHGRSTLVTVVDKEISKWAHNPAIVTMKPLEPIIRAYTHYKEMTLDKMREYIQVAEQPSLYDLREPSEALSAFSSNIPLLIHYNVHGARPSNAFYEVAGNPDLEFRLKKARFAIISGVNPFSSVILSMLHVEDLSTPSYILVDVSQGLIYSRPIGNDSANEILHFLEKPSSTSSPKEFSIHLTTIGNIFYGELLKDFTVKYDLRNPQSGAHEEL